MLDRRAMLQIGTYGIDAHLRCWIRPAARAGLGRCVRTFCLDLAVDTDCHVAIHVATGEKPVLCLFSLEAGYLFPPRDTRRIGRHLVVTQHHDNTICVCADDLDAAAFERFDQHQQRKLTGKCHLYQL